MTTVEWQPTSYCHEIVTPGSAFAGMRTLERGCTEAKNVRVTSALFADNTTIVGGKES